MQSALVDSLFSLILLTFPQRIFTQQGSLQDCGPDKLSVGSVLQDFKIPYTAEKGFKQKTVCNYELTSSPDTKIIFNITSLDIGNGGNCDQNYIKVADTSSGIQTALKHCGTKPPSRAFVSKSNSAVIEFGIKDALENGFVKGTLIAVPVIDPACGPGTLTLQSGSATLKIPPDGKTFTAQALCFYEIQGSNDKKLQLEITHLHLGIDGSCEADFIKVSETKDTLAKTNYSFCGTKIPKDKFVSSTNHLSIAVGTSTDVQKTSIIATYSEVNFVSKLESSKTIVFLLLALVARC